MEKNYFVLIFMFFLLCDASLNAQEIENLSNDVNRTLAALPPPIYEDFGDAPDTYLTEKDSGGPIHTRFSGMPLVNIGAIVDYEYYAFANSKADGDDLDKDSDEDAVVNTDFIGLDKDSDNFSLELDYTNESEIDVNLFGWIDFDQSGQFDADEYTFVKGLKPGQGKGILTWSALKAKGVEIKEGNTFVRLRITYVDLTPADVGGRVHLGEVEDHAIIIGQSTLGIDEELLHKDIRLFPNPVTSALVVKSSSFIERLEIYSLLGRKIRTISTGFAHIELSDLPAGIYMVNVKTEKGSFQKKLVKNKVIIFSCLLIIVGSLPGIYNK